MITNLNKKCYQCCSHLDWYDFSFKRLDDVHSLKQKKWFVHWFPDFVFIVQPSKWASLPLITYLIKRHSLQLALQILKKKITFLIKRNSLPLALELLKKKLLLLCDGLAYC